MTVSKAYDYLRKHGPVALIEILVNFVFPYAIYMLTQRELGDVKALLASSGPPILWSIAELIRKRRIDAFSIFVLAGIALSLLAFLGGGSARFLQLRENFVTVIIGLLFLGSAAVGRPLLYVFAKAAMRRRSQAELDSFEALRDNAHFRNAMMTLTLVWGFGLLGSALLSCLILFAVSIAEYLLVSPAVSYGTMGLLVIWTFWYARSQRRKGDA